MTRHNLNDYQAKERYQSSKIVDSYEKERFQSWYGHLAHQIEIETFEKTLDRYCSKPGTVLDLPCGTARLFPPLLRRGYYVTGGDISEEMLSFARERFKSEPHVSFLKMEAERLPFSAGHFDYLTSYRLMCHLPREVQKLVLSEMLRVVRKIIILNYHFSSLAPLALFNGIFRRYCLPIDPLSEKELTIEIERLGGKVLEISRLSWYERSSALVVIQKN